MLLAAMLLAACGGSDGIDDVQGGGDWSGDTQQKEIRIISNINSMPDGTRTTTYSNAADLQAVGQFTCAAYEANTTTEYIPAKSTDWNSTINRWEFDGGNYHRYWPETGNLDFFAYMPSTANLATDAAYITSGPTYSNDPVAHTVTFSCDMTKSANKEFVFGMTLDMNGENGATGVPIQFIHPFARIRFQLSDASKDNVTINSITFSGDFCKTANYSYNGTTSTWTPFGAATAVEFGSCELNTDYLVIPQTPGSRTLTVNATWKAISTAPQNVSTTIALDWQTGYSYTYILTLKDNILIVNTSKFTEQW